MSSRGGVTARRKNSGVVGRGRVGSLATMVAHRCACDGYGIGRNFGDGARAATTIVVVDDDGRLRVAVWMLCCGTVRDDGVNTFPCGDVIRCKFRSVLECDIGL